MYCFCIWWCFSGVYRIILPSCYRSRAEPFPPVPLSDSACDNPSEHTVPICIIFSQGINFQRHHILRYRIQLFASICGKEILCLNGTACLQRFLIDFGKCISSSMSWLYPPAWGVTIVGPIFEWTAKCHAGTTAKLRFHPLHNLVEWGALMPGCAGRSLTIQRVSLLCGCDHPDMH